MSQHACPGGCGKKFNKGVRRYVLGPDGSVETRLVCKPCAFGRSIQIVVPAEPNACAVCKSGRKASTCSVCANDAAHKAVRMALKPWADFFRTQARVRKAQHHEDGPGLLAAAEFLDVGNAVRVDVDGRGD